MAKGESGRIVLEVDPELKKALYSILAHEQQTLKYWFVDKAQKHIEEKRNELIKSFSKVDDEI
ncbi:hypothetical protein KKJ17_17615 [Xenorhabdus bovienii]|uniref:hypothetical protein n=1 Tax=Xenorhabdus TaxID=626 RepID=UPI00054275FA|nr:MULTISPECIES: hypothetical protein [Xenorhabdus]CEF31498.1 Uncharacterized 7.3 kDa protein in Eco57IM 5'region [Xenorhabdus nematophila str. Websteri]AYA39352.1 hypothetical protein D3790_01625 [Xenorhabdus nematophila]MBA0017926.1 hypothetical protein [Xenorhabdus nematophila]MCB4427058.1 hypothetical protein [Xenorhabdus nematophila]MDE9483833.1 hypothetical protein [Xenorhabdus bovienii]